MEDYPDLPPFASGGRPEQLIPADLASWTYPGERLPGLTHATDCIFANQTPYYLFRLRGLARTHDLGGVVSGGSGRSLTTDRGLLIQRARMAAEIARLWPTWLTLHNAYTFGFLETLTAIEPASFTQWIALTVPQRDHVAQRGPLPLPRIAGVPQQREWRGYHADAVFHYHVELARGQVLHPDPLGTAAHPQQTGAPPPVGGTQGERDRFARETVAFPYAAEPHGSRP